MKAFTRNEFLTLAKLKVDGFTALKRRGQLSFLNRKERNQYTHRDLLLTRAFLHVTGQFPAMSHGAALSIISGLVDLVDTSDPRLVDLDCNKHVLGGSLERQGERVSSFVGDAAELARHLAGLSGVVSVYLVNLSLTAQAISSTAAYFGVEGVSFGTSVADDAEDQ